MLEVGQKAPDFSLFDENNQLVTLSSLHGKKVILYFYPKDYTYNCTREACSFRDNFSAFRNEGIEIYGISRDDEASHIGFKQKHALPFHLLTDKNGNVCEAYGIINKKSFFGNTFLGIKRYTFFIDENGIIKAIWKKVKSGEHAEQILNDLKLRETA